MLLIRSMSCPSRCLSSDARPKSFGSTSFIVVALNAFHRGVDQLADCRLLRLRLQMRPARLRRHPEDAVPTIFIRILGIGSASPLSEQLLVMLLERVGDVLQEQQSKTDVLVLRGIHAAAQRVCHLPELRFVADSG